MKTAPSTIRQRILISVIAVVVLSVLGSIYSLVQVTLFQRGLDHINQVAIPLARLALQLKNDSEIYVREWDRRLNISLWNQPQWRPQRVPRWLEDVLDHELARLQEVTQNAEQPWHEWSLEVLRGYERIRQESEKLLGHLGEGQISEATRDYPVWVRSMEEWSRRVKTGGTDAEQLIRKGFLSAQTQMQDLRTGLQSVLVVVVVFSLLFFWMGERALRPVQVLTELAKTIRVRGAFKKEDKHFMAALATLDPGRTDEISAFTREFHRMATTLLERERTVEDQQNKLQEQNQLLRRMLDAQKELQQKLQWAEHLAAVGRMSAQVAHEVRNPLHSMGLEAELALEQATQPSQREAIGSILAGIDRLEKITENYLKLSRLSSGKKVQFSPEAVLQRVLATYASQASSMGIEVVFNRVMPKSEASVPVCMFGDAELLEQALGNLMHNAIQAVQKVETKQIVWTLGMAESGRLWIRLEDTGLGVPAADQPKLFTPFFTTKAEGSGLGLSFVKKVLENHGADIRYVATGSGAVFEIHGLAPVELLHVEGLSHDSEGEYV